VTIVCTICLVVMASLLCTAFHLFLFPNRVNKFRRRAVLEFYCAVAQGAHDS
jgi:hypothetical protein